MCNPTVTVGIPTFNRVEYLMIAVQSVLHQSYPFIELIVSDNNSIDDTLLRLSTINDTRLKIIRQRSNIGMVNNWNVCLGKATGDYFLLLSDDDWLEPEAIQKMVSLFRSASDGLHDNDNVGIVCCRANLIDEFGVVISRGKNAPREERAEDLIASFFYGKRDMYPCKILFKTNDMRSVGGYPADLFPLSADAYMWILIVMHRGKSFFIDEYLSNYRVHLSSTTSNTKFSIWIKEAVDLGSVCTDYFKSKSTFDAIVEIDKSIKCCICRLVAGAGIELSRSGGSRKAGFTLLFEYRRFFLNSIKNFLTLLITIIKIALPIKVVQTLKPLYKRIRAT